MVARFVIMPPASGAFARKSTGWPASVMVLDVAGDAVKLVVTHMMEWGNARFMAGLKSG
ncbi:hypothetical protein RRH01S_01_03200 [Rhizobium rhizogenes NBRC 13257]|uniref:Uncharacterized protein n=1 Tax=Rhizobium rhizogenes NBRC 13257 TaxID=1220581 RepID=A0AA87Q3W2_RHIRH|nr:hypothetical protein RRH01S_01_03200 [Rhizobium rhizogenes NBRC 13257]